MMTVIEKVLLLQDFELFRQASSEHLAQLAAVAKVIDVEIDSILFRQGETARNLLLLLEGTVVLEDGSIQAPVQRREALDYWSFFSQNPHRYTARTADRCRLLSVSLDDMVDLLTSEAEFCWALTRELARVSYRSQGGLP
jgi:CRP-like cAMP-binding protein